MPSFFSIIRKQHVELRALFMRLSKTTVHATVLRRRLFFGARH